MTPVDSSQKRVGCALKFNSPSPNNVFRRNPDPSLSSKRWRWALALLLVVSGIGLALGLAVHVIDLRPYEQEAKRYLRDQYGRELKLEAPLQLSLWPVLAVAIPRASLSEPGSTRIAASLESATLSLSFLPLLTGRVVIDELQVKGLRARVRRLADGSLNIDTLFTRPDSGGSGVSADDLMKENPIVVIGQIAIEDARLEFTDERSDARVILDDVSLSIERLGSRVVSPMALQGRLGGTLPLQGTVRVQGSLDIDLSRRRVGMRGLEASLRGLLDAKPFDLNARSRYATVTMRGSRPAARLEALAVAFKGSWGGQQFDLAHLRAASLVLDPSNNRFEASALEASARGRDAGTTLEFNLGMPELIVSELEARGKPLEASLKLTGHSPLDVRLSVEGWGGHARELSASKFGLEAEINAGTTSLAMQANSAAVADLDAGILHVKQVSGQIDVDDPRLAQRLRLPLSGELRLDGDNHALTASLQTRLRSSLLSATVALDGDSDPPLQMTAHIDRFDLDEWKSLLVPPPPPPAASSDSKPADAAIPARKTSALGSLLGYDWDAKLSADSIRLPRLQAETLRGTLSVRGDRISLTGLHGRLYGGHLEAHGRLDPDRHRVALRMRGTDIALGSLLRGTAGVSLIDGRADFSAELDTVAEWQLESLIAALQGHARLAMREGSLSGVDLQSLLGQVLSRLPLPSAPSVEARRTAESQSGFASLSANFRIDAGQARSDDFALTAAGLLLSARGSVNLNDGALAWRGQLRATPDSIRDSQLSVLRRLQLPLVVSGTVSDARWQIELPGRSPIPR